MSETDNNVLSPALMDFKESSVIDNVSDDLIHVVWFCRIVRNYIVEHVSNPASRIG